MNPLLLRLTTEDFADSIGFVLPPAPLRRVLQHSTDIRRLETALRYGEITEKDVREFVNQCLLDFRRGELFRHDISLAGLAVAMEHWKSSFAEEYLIDLARVRRPEFRSSFRIARECLKARFAFPRTQIRNSPYPRGQAAPIVPLQNFRAMPCVTRARLDAIGIQWVRYSEVTHACD